MKGIANYEALCTLNRVREEWNTRYGVSVLWYDEANELLRDMGRGCVIALNGENPIEQDTVRVKQDGTVVLRSLGPRGAVKTKTLEPSELAVMVGRITGYEDALEALEC